MTRAPLPIPCSAERLVTNGVSVTADYAPIAPDTRDLTNDELLMLAFAVSDNGRYRVNHCSQVATGLELCRLGYLTDRTRPGHPYEFKITPAGADVVARKTVERRTNGR